MKNAKRPIRVRKSVSAESSVKQDDVLIVLTQAFCTTGHNLIRPGEQFMGFDGLQLWVSDGAKEGLVVVSPIHGDGSKKGLSFRPGAKLEISCPECRTPLPHLCRCSCGKGGSLRTIYLTPDLSDAHQAAVCDIWGCPRSRVIDSNEILSEFIDAELAAEG
ncbi:MAG TPA: hypothetical protein VGQ83_05460 [Polyangia bacterium]